MRDVISAFLIWILLSASSAMAFPCTFDTDIDSFEPPEAGWPVTPVRIGTSLAYSVVTNDIGVDYVLLHDCRTDDHVLANSGINPETTSSEFATALHDFIGHSGNAVTIASFLEFVQNYGAEFRTEAYGPVGHCDCERLWPNTSWD